MDMMHSWAIWRILIIGLIALPFLVAAMVTGFLQRNTKASSNAGHADNRASSEVSGPTMWGKQAAEPMEQQYVGAAAAERRAA